MFTLLTFAASSHVSAACILRTHIRVGADTTNCQANDIATAISLVPENNACPVVIDVTPEHTYTNQQLTISNRRVILQGWGEGVTCAAIPGDLDLPPYQPPDAAQPLITLDGSNGGRVLTINGDSNVSLRNLTIIRGSAGRGAGIDFDGTGSLYLTRSTISYNNADFGAGVSMYGDGGAATLTIGDDTILIGNIATQSGGGVLVFGNARLFVRGSSIDITYNHATNALGGGIDVIGPARADIGSPGYGLSAVINHNDAVNGGGIAVGDNGTGSAVVRLFPSDDSNPTKLDDNSATGNGGAIYAEGASDVCLFAPSLHRNLATEGAAIYKRDGGGIYLNAGIPSRLGAECGPETVAALGGATGCAYGGDCNVFAYNKTEDSGSNPTDGAILFHYNAELIGSRFRLQHNSSAQVITANSGGTIISRCLVTDNDIREAAILSYYWGGGTTQIGECTIANNTMYTGGYVLDMEVISQVSIGSLIIAEPGIPSLRYIPLYSGEQLQAHYILSSEVATIGSDPTLTASPNLFASFVDVFGGDYHLRSDSPAIDYAPAHVDESLDCATGIYDLPNVVNTYGPQDLGAYELPPSDRIYASGFGDAVAPLNSCDTNATGSQK